MITIHQMEDSGNEMANAQLPKPGLRSAAATEGNYPRPNIRDGMATVNLNSNKQTTTKSKPPMKNAQHTFVKLAVCSFIFLTISLGQLQGQPGDLLVIYHYKSDTPNPDGSPRYSYGYKPFLGVVYSADATFMYCADDHRAPGTPGNRYTHAHVPHGFPFTGNGEQITVPKADAGWDHVYLGYGRESSATCAHNCHSYSADAPLVMDKATGWQYFTEGSSVCESTTKRKSMSAGIGVDHTIRILATSPSYIGSCLVATTAEKNASSGVYRKIWGITGYPDLNEVRKRR